MSPAGAAGPERKNLGSRWAVACRAWPASRLPTAPQFVTQRRSTIAEASTTISAMARRDFVARGIQRFESTVVGNDFMRSRGRDHCEPGVGRTFSEGSSHGVLRHCGEIQSCFLTSAASLSGR